MGRKLGTVPLFEEELGPDLTECGLGLGLLYTKWHLDSSSRLATTIDMDQKVGGCCAPFFEGEAESSKHNVA